MLAAAGKGIVHALQHVLGTDVCEKAQPAPIDAEHRNIAGGRHARRMQHRPVAAHCHQQLRAFGQFLLADRVDVRQPEPPDVVGDGPDPVAPCQQVVHQRADRFADARLGGSSRQGDAAAMVGGRVHGCPAF